MCLLRVLNTLCLAQTAKYEFKDYSHGVRAKDKSKETTMGAGRENTKRVTPVRDRNGETSKRFYGSSCKEIVTNPDGRRCVVLQKKLLLISTDVDCNFKQTRSILGRVTFISVATSKKVLRGLFVRYTYVKRFEPLPVRPYFLA